MLFRTRTKLHGAERTSMTKFTLKTVFIAKVATHFAAMHAPTVVRMTVNDVTVLWEQ